MIDKRLAQLRRSRSIHLIPYHVHYMMTSPAVSILKKWVVATRLETTVLACASVGLGSALAAYAGTFRLWVGLWAALTASLLQVVCNLANDYGDFVQGADLLNTAKVPSAIQTALVTREEVRLAVQWLVVPTLGCGLMLLHEAKLPVLVLALFLLVGFLAVVAAITYTVGQRPYGYRGWGDVAVMLFFGLVGVGGTFYLHTQQLSSLWLGPALSHGCLVVGVLNVNNIRDIVPDAQAGKCTIPVRIGRIAALYYHWALLGCSMLAMLVFLRYHAPTAPWLYLCTSLGPCLWQHGRAVCSSTPAQLTQQLQLLVLLDLLLVGLLSVGLLLS